MAVTDLPTSAEALERVLESGDKVRELRALPESKRGDTFLSELRAATAACSADDVLYDIASKRERDEAERAAWDNAIANPPAPESRGPFAAFADVSADEYRTAGDQFVRGMGSEKGDKITRQNMISEDDGIEVRNLLTGSSGGTPAAGLFAPIGSPQLYTPPRQRRLFVRDLLSVVQTNLTSIPYIRELNAATNETGASSVAEASAKPEVTMEFAGFDAPIRKIAAWVQATEEILEDAPTVKGYIDTRLAYMLMLREEAQVIGVGAGGGNAPNIKGILDFSTEVQTNTGEFYDGVGVSIGKIENVEGDADGVAVNPVDFWAAVTDRHNTFYDGNAFASGGAAPFNSPSLTAWGLPVVRTRSLASGTAIVGAWRMGATLFERKGVTIRTTDSHASLFVSNTWIILAEERVGLAVHRPDFFVKLTVSAPS
jgi:HK97 family phage major capsid protein